MYVTLTLFRCFDVTDDRKNKTKRKAFSRVVLAQTGTFSLAYFQYFILSKKEKTKKKEAQTS